MNPKFYSLLLCAIFSSTLVQETTSKSLHALKSLERSRREAVINYGTIIDSAGGLLSLSNSTSNDALVIDLVAHVFVLLDGKGSGIGIDPYPDNLKGSIISKGLWNASEESLLDSLSALNGSLASLFKATNDDVELFDLHTGNLALNTDVLDQITSIVRKLTVPFIEADFDEDNTLAFKLVTSIANDFLDVLKDDLDALPGLISDYGSIPINVDIAGVINHFWGLEMFIKELGVNLFNIIEEGVDFDLSLMEVDNGYQCLAQLIDMVGQKIDLSPVDCLLGDMERRSLLIAKLDGYRTVGMIGVTKTLYKIAAYHNRHTTLDILLGNIVQHVAWSSLSVLEDQNDYHNQSVKKVRDAITSAKAEKELSKFTALTDAALDGRVMFAGKNLFDLQTLLYSVTVNSTHRLEIVAKSISLMEPLVEPREAFVYLVLILMAKLQSEAGIEQIMNLGINLTETTVDDIRDSLIAAKSDVLSISKNDPVTVLEKLPVIKDIMVSVDNVLKKNGTFTLAEAFENRHKILPGFVAAVLQVLTGIDMDMEESLLEAAEDFVEIHNSHEAFVGVEIEDILH